MFLSFAASIARSSCSFCWTVVGSRRLVVDGDADRAEQVRGHLGVDGGAAVVEAQHLILGRADDERQRGDRRRGCARRGAGNDESRERGDDQQRFTHGKSFVPRNNQSFIAADPSSTWAAWVICSAGWPYSASSAATSCSAPKRTGSPAGRPVSSSAASIALCASSSSSLRVFSAMHADARAAARERRPLVQLDELAQRRDRVALVVVTKRCPAWWQSTSRCGAEPWKRPSVTPEYCGWSSEPCPSTISSSPPRAMALDDETLCSAGDEVRDDGVDGDAPACDRDAGLSRRHELRGERHAASPRGRARARRSSSRSRSRSRP